MIGDSRLTASHLALIAWWVAVAWCVSSALAAATPTTLMVQASNGLPGFHRADLSRYLALHMAEAGLADWRFEPATETGPAPDRVEWSFKLNPYAGGEVRRFVRSLIDQRSLHAHRPITIEARLYLNGEYQTLVEKQETINEGGDRDDPHLVEAIASVTQNLLGPLGAYRAIDLGRGAASRPK